MIRATVSTLGTLQEDTRAARDRLKEENLRLVVELGKFNCLPQAPGLARDRDHDGHTKRHGIDRERNVSERCDIDGDIVMANSSTAGAIGSEPLEPHTRSVSGSPLRTPSGEHLSLLGLTPHTNTLGICVVQIILEARAPTVPTIAATALSGEVTTERRIRVGKPSARNATPQSLRPRHDPRMAG